MREACPLSCASKCIADLATSFLGKEERCLEQKGNKCRGELRQELEEPLLECNLGKPLSLSHSLEPVATSQYSSADELESNSLLVSVNCSRL